MQITKNFKLSEFDSRDGKKVPFYYVRNVVFLAENLQVIRDEIKEPIMITSGYRSITHNINVGGVKNSYHLYGMAADITVRNKTPKEVAELIKELIEKGEIEPGGLGLYDGFVHYDVRGSYVHFDKSKKYNL